MNKRLIYCLLAAVLLAFSNHALTQGDLVRSLSYFAMGIAGAVVAILESPNKRRGGKALRVMAGALFVMGLILQVVLFTRAN